MSRPRMRLMFSDVGSGGRTSPVTAELSGSGGAGDRAQCETNSTITIPGRIVTAPKGICCGTQDETDVPAPAWREGPGFGYPILKCDGKPRLACKAIKRYAGDPGKPSGHRTIQVSFGDD